MHPFFSAIFSGERTWAWRRRMSFAGCLVFLGGVVNSIWFDHDMAHYTTVLATCQLGFATTLATYVGLAVTDDHLRRETDRKAAEGGGQT